MYICSFEFVVARFVSFRVLSRVEGVLRVKERVLFFQDGKRTSSLIMVAKRK